MHVLRLREFESLSLGHVDDLYALLRAIDETMPDDAVLNLEGTSIAPDIVGFLEARQTTVRQEVARGTLWPLPATFHLPLENGNLAELRALAERHAEPELCDHLAVYRADQLLLTAHDAGFGEVYLVRSLSEETIRRFRLALTD